MTVSIRNIIKQSAKFNFVSIISLLMKISNQIIIGMFLLPEEYEIILIRIKNILKNKGFKYYLLGEANE